MDFFVKQRLTLNLVIVIDFLQENYVNSNVIDGDDWNCAENSIYSTLFSFREMAIFSNEQLMLCPNDAVKNNDQH